MRATDVREHHGLCRLTVSRAAASGARPLQRGGAPRVFGPGGWFSCNSSETRCSQRRIAWNHFFATGPGSAGGSECQAAMAAEDLTQPGNRRNRPRSSSPPGRAGRMGVRRGTGRVPDLPSICDEKSNSVGKKDKKSKREQSSFSLFIKSNRWPSYRPSLRREAVSGYPARDCKSPSGGVRPRLS
jgi:hypothetical protein